MIMAEGKIRTRWLYWKLPTDLGSLFYIFLRNEDSFHCGLLLLLQMLPSWNWDGGVTCRMLRLTLLPSPGEKKKQFLWLIHCAF